MSGPRDGFHCVSPILQTAELVFRGVAKTFVGDNGKKLADFGDAAKNIVEASITRGTNLPCTGN